MTEISIIIPVYNAEKVLKTTLNSVLAQTFTDFEAICINDGSSDSSWQILQEFAQTDSRFKIYNQENAGGSIARNNGLEKASGKYIAFLDNDDIYHPQYLEILYKNLKSTNADVSCCSYLSFEGYGDYSFCHKIKNNKIHFVSANPFTDKFQKKKKIETLMWTKLYKKELLNNLKFSPKLPAINDILFNMEILLSSSRVVVTKQKLIAYRLIETSQTRQKLSLKKLDEYKNLAMKINALGFKYPQHRKLLEKIAANYVYGMYAKDVFCASASENKQSLAKRIIEDLDFLHSEKIINFSRLNYKKENTFMEN